MSSVKARHTSILERMLQNGLVKVADLAKEFGVTPTTIRKDLHYLESQGKLFRAYGSALPSTTQVLDIYMSAKKVIKYEQKLRIAQAANSMIEPNDSIILSSGSTVAIFAENIAPVGRVNLVSTSVSISSLLGEKHNVSVMQVGGLLYSNTLSVVGASAINAISNIYCSKSFIGVDGFDPEFGISCGAHEEADLLRQIMRSSKNTIVLSDSSKFGKRGLSRICPIEEVNTIITDDGLLDRDYQLLTDRGIKVIRV